MQRPDHGPTVAGQASDLSTAGAPFDRRPFVYLPSCVKGARANRSHSAGERWPTSFRPHHDESCNDASDEGAAALDLPLDRLDLLAEAPSTRKKTLNSAF
jgi:hypothetical protein